MRSLSYRMAASCNDAGGSSEVGCCFKAAVQRACATFEASVSDTHIDGCDCQGIRIELQRGLVEATWHNNDMQVGFKPMVGYVSF